MMVFAIGIEDPLTMAMDRFGISFASQLMARSVRSLRPSGTISAHQNAGTRTQRNSKKTG